MDKNILIKLSELADELDSNHLYKEANIVTETMTRIAQEMGDEKPWWQTPLWQLVKPINRINECRRSSSNINSKITPNKR